ncbi:MAG TPA: inositol-3-phosphate synthase [Myxococcota bacterium]|nr:inositol-3-phosphate synthase [Myxococcota bacterium]HRY94014.1 inositol-3-phosphate synthase [Myxococcota bacterium]
MTDKGKKISIAPAKGLLGVLTPGLGAVATTLIGGVEAVRRGIAKPIGSVTQMSTIRLGKRTEKRAPLIKDFVPLAGLDSMRFGGWDVFHDDCYQAAHHAEVLHKQHLDELRPFLERIKPMSAVFDPRYVKKLKGDTTNVKDKGSLMEKAEALMRDMDDFAKREKVDRLVVCWCASTEAFLAEKPVHKDLAKFEKGLRESNPDIAPSMVYAYAALKKGIPYVNGAPNLSTDIPALLELADKTGSPLAGKDYKTGQTLMKTILAPGLKARMLGVAGWFSTNILGNRDGEVLDDPESFKTKEVSKLGVLDYILQPDLYPDLYKGLCHVVRINYYPPRGDAKEGWDNIDIVGWLGYPMQIKIDFLCRDSILAAPVALDVILFMDLAKRAGLKGIQEWLSFYFKSPLHLPKLYPEHDLFIQQMKLKNTLRYLMGEAPITHLGNEYYDF